MNIPTWVARARFGDNDFRGYVLNEQLVGRVSWTQMMVLAVGGGRLCDEDAKVIDVIASASCVADPRIWPLKATRLGGAFGSIFAAQASGALMLDGSVMESTACREASARLQALLPKAQDIHSDSALAELLAVEWPERFVLGFGVPGRPFDERVAGIRSGLEVLGRTDRPYWTLHERVTRIMRDVRGMESNLVLGFSAAALDIGLEPNAIGALALASALVAVYANAVESREVDAPTLRLLSDEHIQYDGPMPRLSPRARKSTT